MTEKVMPVRAQAAVLAFVAGAEINVSATCRECGISRRVFYKYVERCRLEGAAGLEPRSRRPHRSPQAVDDDVDDAVVVLRKELADRGVDEGARTIQWHLGQDRRFEGRVPSVRTVHRILVRRGFVTPQPNKRPKSSWRRFEAPLPNELWQIDATGWSIVTGDVEIFNIIDDHSRLACGSRAVMSDTGDEAWATFSQAALHWGLPARILSDNGLCFSGKLRGYEVLFEARLRDVGIRPIVSRAFHPQTTGKVERFQQTLKKWLAHHDQHHGVAADLPELQARLDAFCTYYNRERPHQGIGRVTPISRWMASPPATAGAPIDHPAPRPAPLQVTITNGGQLRAGGYRIGVGTEWAGCPATVILDDHHATIFAQGSLVRHLKLDTTRPYQPVGRPPGGPRRPRRLQS